MAIVNDYHSEIVGQNKRPTTVDPHVGVEIECFSTKLKKNNWLAERLEKELIKKDLHYSCSVVDDGSINPKLPHKADCYAGECTCTDNYDLDGVTAEVRVLGTERSIYNTIEQVCATLKELECSVNDTCGLHVHIDVRHRKWESVAAALLKNQAKLWKVVAPFRKLSRYCKPVVSIENRGHHFCFDFTQVSAHNTIEVRMHHGTLDASEINAFIRMLLEIVNGVGESKATKEYREKQAKRFGYSTNLKLKTIPKKVLIKKPFRLRV